MKFSFEILGLSRANIYFTCDVCENIKDEIFELSHLAENRGLPLLVRRILNIWGISHISIKRNTISIDRFDPDVDFHFICYEIARLVGIHHPWDTPPPNEISLEEFRKVHPGLPIYEPPV